MNYAEAAYFDGQHCSHAAVWQQRKWDAEKKRRLDMQRRSNDRRR